MQLIKPKLVRVFSFKTFFILFISLLLSACVSSLLIGNQFQSKLMWSFLKPLVGFDPNEVNLFEAPIIKNRMTALLGDKYEPTMKLLRTAQEIQQEGALFYVASRYAPPQAKAITDKAAMIWNADTNQMAVMLINDDVTEIFSEQIDGAKEKIAPKLPQELQRAYSQAQAAKKALEEKRKALENVKEIIENPVEAVTETLNQNINQNIDQKIDQKIDEHTNKAKTKAKAKTKESIAPLLPLEPEIDEAQRDFEEAMKREANELKREAGEMKN